MATLLPILTLLFGFLGKLIWPLFLWCFTQRKDVQVHIRGLLKQLDRLGRLKFAGVDMTLKPTSTLDRGKASKALIFPTPPKQRLKRPAPTETPEP